MLGYIVWNFDPVLVDLFGIEIRWYGLMFAISFGLGYWLLGKMLKKAMPQTSSHNNPYGNIPQKGVY